MRQFPLDAATEARLITLDPERVTAADVRRTLARAPAPRLILLHGGAFPAQLVMSSLSSFLHEMGYPEDKLKHPGDGRLSHSPYEDSEQVAGLVAWYYEHEGVRPMLIGHSQGGMLAVRVLHDLAGAFEPELQVWNPYTDAAEPRTTITDPLTGTTRPVVGLSVSFASAVAAGGPAGLLPNQWKVAWRLHDVPDTVDEFAGYSIGVDLFAWTFSGAWLPEFRNQGRVAARNVVLPATYFHVTVPVAHHLSRDASTREWIDRYRPGRDFDPAAVPGRSAENALYAADLWFGIKKHWVLEAQRFVRARRTAIAVK